MANTLRILILAAVFVVLPTQLPILVEDPGSYPYILAAQRHKAEIKRAMRYHGTDFAFADGSTWYFRNRDGKLCRLFNKNYKSYMKSAAVHSGDASQS